MAIEREIGRENPDYVIACVGGGSNAGELYHFVDEPSIKLLPHGSWWFWCKLGKSAKATTFLGTTGVLHGSKKVL